MQCAARHALGYRSIFHVGNPLIDDNNDYILMQIDILIVLCNMMMMKRSVKLLKKKVCVFVGGATYKQGTIRGCLQVILKLHTLLY